MAPEDQLCLLLAGGRFSPQAERSTRQLLAGALDWDRFLQLVREHEILPLVCRNLQRLSFPGVPQPIQTELKELFASNALRNALLAAELARVLSLLADAQVPVMPLKGIPLAESLYGDAALRVCADIDLLVQPKYFAEAFGVLRSSGYEAGIPPAPMVKLVARYGKDCALTRQDRVSSYPLQLHCGVVWGGPAERGVSERMWSEAVDKSFHGVRALALSGDWEFLYLAIHAARHGLGCLKWLVDLDQLCYQNTLDWGRVQDRAKRLGWERAVGSSLAACAALLDTPMPAGFAAAAPVVPAGWNSSGGSALQVPRETLFSIRLLTSWSQRLGFVAVRLFVPTPRDCEFLSLPSSLFFLYYLWRPLRVTGLLAGWFVRAGVRLVRGGQVHPSDYKRA